MAAWRKDVKESGNSSIIHWFLRRTWSEVGLTIGQIGGNREEHSFVSSSLESHPHDDASAPKNPGEERTSLKGKWKIRTPPDGTLRQRWKNFRKMVRVMEPRTGHCKQNIFEQKRVTERRVIRRNEIRWTVWNWKNWRDGKRPWTGCCKACREREEN